MFFRDDEDDIARRRTENEDKSMFFYSDEEDDDEGSLFWNSKNKISYDELYGGDVSNISRQALHCTNLKFIHPITDEVVNVRADLPEDMINIIKHNE